MRICSAIGRARIVGRWEEEGRRGPMNMGIVNTSAAVAARGVVDGRRRRLLRPLIAAWMT